MKNFGGGMPNMQQLMKQAQKMQKQMEETQAALEEKVITATSGGGMVEVTVTGKKEVKAIKIKEEVVDPEDIETLEDLVLTAVNEAIRQAEEYSQKEMSKVTGGLPTGGLF
ncbi:MAG: YbaB/EbfC family nucleoid-associated protein [Clostridia bacterium]|jgi:DNA-binding YbaB/EbfC family protein|nr:YbaB/EbfC family nucleoid-associated protein [Clostridia bacterium]